MCRSQGFSCADAFRAAPLRFSTDFYRRLVTARLRANARRHAATPADSPRHAQLRIVLLGDLTRVRLAQLGTGDVRALLATLQREQFRHMNRALLKLGHPHFVPSTPLSRLVTALAIVVALARTEGNR